MKDRIFKGGNRNFAKIALLLFGGAFLSACGGGGGGGSGSATAAIPVYSGKTTQAAISAANADTLANTAYNQGVPFAASVGSLGGLKPSVSGVTDAILAKAAVQAQNLLGSGTSTFQGPCGGTLTSAVTNNTDGSSAGTLVWSDFCVNNVTYNGIITAEGTTASSIGTVDITVASDAISVSLAMNIGITKDGATAIINMTGMNMVAVDSSTGESLKYENFALSQSVTLATLDYSMETSGRFYYSTYGYVDIATPVALTGNGSNNPSAGTVRFTGAGSAVEMRFVDAAAYELWIDAGGSGNYMLEGAHSW